MGDSVCKIGHGPAPSSEREWEYGGGGGGEAGESKLYSTVVSETLVKLKGSHLTPTHLSDHIILALID